MKKKLIVWMILAVLAVFLAGCGKKPATESAAPTAVPQPAVTATPQPTATPRPESTDAPHRQDGERFETVITVEGMEETVRYEHIRNETIGIEMDYDYERFVRYTDGNSERFVSVWDDPAHPENYLEITFDTGSPELVADALSTVLSQEYDLTRVDRDLENAGRCIRIEASVIKGTNRMAEQLEAVYIIPAPDGVRLATTHAFIVESEGMWRRFDCMLHTLSVIERDVEGELSDGAALTAVQNYCYLANPDLEEIVSAGEYPVYWEVASSDAEEIVILFRSYTGAENRFYVNRSTGDTRVTEFVPGITPEEAPTEERFNVLDYLG